MPDWIELDEQAKRQYFDAREVFEAWESARDAAQTFSGGMFWRVSKGNEYLIRSGKDNRQHSLGRRSMETEATFERFMSEKRQAQSTLTALRHQMAMHYRQNRALGVGNAPALLIRALSAFNREGLREDVLVTGDCALFAYTALACVRLPERDELAEPRLSLQFVAADRAIGERAFAALCAVDKSFVASQVTDERLKARNSEGNVVEIYVGWHVGMFAKSTPRETRTFSAPIVSATGRMARMTTVHPQWYASNALDQREHLNAGMVLRLLDFRLPEWREESRNQTKALESLARAS